MAARCTRSRRGFLRECAGGTIGAIFTFSGAVAIAAAGPVGSPRRGRRMMMLGEVTVDEFTPYLNTSFQVRADSAGALQIELVEAEGLGYASVPRGSTPRRQGFSLIFKGPAQPRLEQGTYTVAHDSLGDADLPRADCPRPAGWHAALSGYLHLTTVPSA